MIVARSFSLSLEVVTELDNEARELDMNRSNCLDKILKTYFNEKKKEKGKDE